MSAHRLHLVRHARPHIDPDVAAKDWQLDARASVAELSAAGVLPPQATWFSSPEPKAHQTASLLTTSAVQVLPALAEAGRGPQLLPEEQFRAAVMGYLSDGDAPQAWEPRVEVTLRVVDAALAALAMSTGPDCVLVGHGTAFTLLVGALVGQPPDAQAWAELRMPDYCQLQAAANGAFELTAPWGSWAQQPAAHS